MRPRNFCSVACHHAWIARNKDVVLARGDDYIDRSQGAHGCWNWIGARDPKGYGRVRIGNQTELAHRVAWVEQNGPIPDGLFACHHCDNPSCVNPDHLFLGTVRDNAHDMVAKGRSAKNDRRGEDIGTAKLTVRQVQEMRAMYVPKVVTQPMLAALFGVSRSTVSAIVSGRNWAWVEQ